MLNLSGKFSYDTIRDIDVYTSQRFKDKSSLMTPEALTLKEQGYATDAEIKELCEEVLGHELFEPAQSYISEDIVRLFDNTGLVPVLYRPMRKEVIAVYSDEFDCDKGFNVHWLNIVKQPTTLPYYIAAYTKLYGKHNCLSEVPAKTLFNGIVKEAIDLGAIDITISSVGSATIVYYNIKKQKVRSNKIFDYTLIEEIIKLLTVKSPMDMHSCKPKDVDVDLTKEYRGRVCINTKVGGYTITIRLLPNKAFTTDLSELGVTGVTERWLRTAFMDTTPGLHLMVGATMSGKNTTILSVLKELAESDALKIVSIEMPVEQTLPGIEQISVEKEEEFNASVKSLIRVNPDIVYITEIRDSTGLPAVQVTNTGKCVYSTLHSNSVADTISRLTDITGLSQDRIIQALHSICYQELRYNKVTKQLYPYDRFVRFSNELKQKLYGKSIGDVIAVIQEAEEGDNDTD